MILTGAPGTGKTFLARNMALKLISGKPDEKLLSAEEQTAFENQYRFVQFHPSYDYTDFVEGLSPTKPGASGYICFERQDGVFKEFCKTALKACEYDTEGKFDEEKSVKCVFVIDEINRGEISKIFGELFFSIDPDYRGKNGLVQTQYANLISEDDPFKAGFYVPENVYIIGTMNDIDRSVESFDFAMRRRFSWIEITAEESAKKMNLTDEVKKRMKNLNEAISKIEGLNPSYHIGGAYFLKSQDNKYDKLWDYHLEPLLREYLRGMPDAKERLTELHRAFEPNYTGD
jgi:5-methylcytosine-specific restriction endonuclease McrBC GTP-binding regulatory subunit McrB